MKTVLTVNLTRELVIDEVVVGIWTGTGVGVVKTNPESDFVEHAKFVEHAGFVELKSQFDTMIYNIKQNFLHFMNSFAKFFQK